MDQLPDYGNEATIAFYELRYAYGYAFEYYCIYRLALALIGDPSVVSAVSLGCGSGLDRYSLSLALLDVEGGREVRLDSRGRGGWRGDPTRWLGIDIVSWGKVDDIRLLIHDNVIQVLEGGAVEYFDRMSTHGEPCDRTVFFFGRILSELSSDVMDSLCEAIAGVTYSRESIILCIANRASGERSELEKSQRVIDAFAEAGFGSVQGLTQDVIESLELGDGAWLERRNEAAGDVDALWHIVDEYGEAVSIEDAASTIEGFETPWQLRALRRLSPWKECRKYGSQCGRECPTANHGKGITTDCPLAKNPVTTTSQMNFQIVKLSK